MRERVRVRKPLRTAKELLQTEKFTFFHSRSSQILLRKSGCHQTLLPPTVERWRILIYAGTVYCTDVHVTTEKDNPRSEFIGFFQRGITIYTIE